MHARTMCIRSAGLLALLLGLTACGTARAAPTPQVLAADITADTVPPPDQADVQAVPATAPSGDGATVMLGRVLDGTVCERADGTLLAELTAPESETAYVVDLDEPVTMTIYGEGFTDVSDTVAVDVGDGHTAYTASFVTDTDGFGLDEVRVAVPGTPAACD